jgi:hypothetical protein
MARKFSVQKFSVAHLAIFTQVYYIFFGFGKHRKCTLFFRRESLIDMCSTQGKGWQRSHKDNSFYLPFYDNRKKSSNRSLNAEFWRWNNGRSFRWKLNLAEWIIVGNGLAIHQAIRLSWGLVWLRRAKGKFVEP